MDDAERAIPVPAALRPWVARAAGAAAAGAGAGRRIRVEAPDAATTLVFRTTAAGSELAVVGPRTRASYFEVGAVPFCVEVRMRPGRARALLGRPLRGLADRVVPLGELWGDAGARLADDLAGLGDDSTAVLDRLGGTLLARLPTQAGRDLARSELAHGAAVALSIHADPRRVGVAARQLGVSERHLRTLFTEAVGVPPKHFARIDRVRAVLARAGRESWGYLAAEAGYYDQSHMTAEFRDIMGVPPGAFLAGRFPAATPCVP